MLINNPPLPLVSIGVPVYNEERFLAQTLDSLLLQDYKNIQIIISDNASTDHTKSICQSYISRFNHIEYHRQVNNTGVTANFNFVLNLSRGKYFMWASGHDLWEPNYISECVSLLESDPSTVIAFGITQWIGANDVKLPKLSGSVDTRGLDVITRFVITFWASMNPILGLIKRDFLSAYPLDNSIGTDMIALCRLSLIGDFALNTNTAWSRREFREEKSYNKKLKRYKSEKFKLASSRLDKIFPLAKLPLFLFKIILISNQSKWIKMLLALLVIFMLPARFFAGSLSNSTCSNNR